MGLDFSYLLYFKRENLWDALQGVANVSRPCPLPTLVVFPDHIRAVQLEAWVGNERIFQHDHPKFGFVTSIYFPADEAIEAYLRRVSIEHFESMKSESPLGLPVGCIYITVYNDQRGVEEESWDPDLVLIEFGTPGTTMSILFSESLSIRKRFESLLAEYGGVCGIFNMEDRARVLWHKGRSMDFEIENPFMSPGEIEILIEEKRGKKHA